MSAPVAVGFSPAPNPVLPTAVSAAASTTADAAPAAEGDVFGQLLALLVPALTPQRGNDAPAFEKLLSLAAGSADAVETKAEDAAADPVDPLAALLDQLVAALTPLRDAAAAGQPAPPAAAVGLTDALDALSALLGASPAANAAPATPGPDAPADAELSPAGATQQAIPVPPVLTKLSDQLGRIAGELREAAPAIAEQLTAIADRLKLGDVPPVLQERLLASADAEGRNLADLLLARLAGLPGHRPEQQAQQQPLAPPVLTAPALTGESTEQDAAPLAPAATRTSSPAAPATAARAPEPVAAPRPQTAPIDETAAKAEPGTTAAPVTSGTAAPPSGIKLASAAYQAQVPQLNLPAMAVEIVRQFDAGNTRFQIRLDPPELGRIDVRLDVDRHGTVNARMIVERPETLDLMQRDQRALQQALQQAGLDQQRANLEFSLRQNPFGAGQQGSGGERDPVFSAPGDEVAADATAGVPTVTLYRATATAGGLNLVV